MNFRRAVNGPSSERDSHGICCTAFGFLHLRWEKPAAREAVVTAALYCQKDDHATISCGIDLTVYAALCFANIIKRAY
jgi:hypothetical protein